MSLPKEYRWSEQVTMFICHDCRGMSTFLTDWIISSIIRLRWSLIGFQLCTHFPFVKWIPAPSISAYVNKTIRQGLLLHVHKSHLFWRQRLRPLQQLYSYSKGVIESATGVYACNLFCVFGNNADVRLLSNIVEERATLWTGFISRKDREQ